jgi:ankyrin repeat protein
VRLLLADIDAKDNDGFTALMLAANDGYAHIVSLLIAHIADVNLKSNPPYENTALILACISGNCECVRRGASPTVGCRWD